MTLNETEKNLGYTFRDKKLLERALTLPSADKSENNQTLEFFGDAILEFLVSEKIYDENSDEGSLTEKRKSLVSDNALAPVSRKLGLDKALIRSPYDSNNKKAVPSVYEAVIAAIYLDGGIEAARKFVFSTLNFNRARTEENFKGELQEYLQSRGESCPKYVRNDTGTPQHPQFSVSVELFGRVFTGVSGNVRQAEQSAAKSAMEYIKSLICEKQGRI